MAWFLLVTPHATTGMTSSAMQPDFISSTVPGLLASSQALTVGGTSCDAPT
jgi:hypothetical protein